MALTTVPAVLTIGIGLTGLFVLAFLSFSPIAETSVLCPDEGSNFLYLLHTEILLKIV